MMYDDEKPNSQSRAIPTPTLYSQSIKIDQTDEPQKTTEWERNVTYNGNRVDCRDTKHYSLPII